MALSLNYHWLVGFLLVLARALGWLMVVPPFSNRASIPPIATMCTAAALGVLIAPSVPESMIPLTVAGFIGSVVVQVLTGAAMGFVIFVLLTTASTAGNLVDLMGGLNLPPSLDPLSLDQSSVLGQLYLQLAVILLFVSGGYSLLIDGFARSFQTPGFALSSAGRLGEVLVIDFATMFTSALEIVAPILAVLFATQVMLALLSKAAPQMNVWILGMPIQLFVAIALVALGVSALPNVVGNLLARALGDTAHLFGG